MLKTLNHTEETLVALCADEIDAISGGSIYIDGVYWGEGDLDLRPWPGGFPVWNRWPDGSRTPHF